ncbi:hypothetical protein POM88_024079 [Heracleum sosnowskyi]|uniref:Uncharacterized protein n=1 Tax=Heracleum sosnowskyi TaxID=360622 RepID=A0AAD8MV84_9APIA|nr:hypothetical protein POM88_024079 [Heracleum sosnowskyi]
MCWRNKRELKRLKELVLKNCSALTEIFGLRELVSLERIVLEGRRSPLLALILNKPLFQIYSGFEQQIAIHLWDWIVDEVNKFPDWIIQSSVQGSVVDDLTEEISSSVNLQPNLSQNYLGLILCFAQVYDELDFSVMTSASNVFRSYLNLDDSSIVIVPRSIFTVTDTDTMIKFTSNARRHWIHLLYKNEDDSTTVNVEDGRNNPYYASDSEVEEE